eukprot:COSAG01_NODE_554_length_15534_cov_101.167541_14_plen_129_part_00
MGEHGPAAYVCGADDRLQLVLLQGGLAAAPVQGLCCCADDAASTAAVGHLQIFSQRLAGAAEQRNARRLWASQSSQQAAASRAQQQGQARSVQSMEAAAQATSEPGVVRLALPRSCSYRSVATAFGST